MFTNQIRQKLKKDVFAKAVFKDVLPLDKLPLKVNYPSAYVINTDPSYLQGEHWLALLFDEKGHCVFRFIWKSSKLFWIC